MNFEMLRYNEEIPYTALIDSEVTAVSATIKVCLVQLHCDVSAGFTSAPVCPRCCKKKRRKKRRLDNAVAGTSILQSLFVTTTAGEDETSESNRGHSNG